MADAPATPQATPAPAPSMTRAAPAGALAWPVPGAPPSAPPSPLPVTPGRPRSIAPLQALDDAVNYRRARLAIDCDDCQPGQLCDDHHGDVHLIAVYRQMHQQAAALPPYPQPRAAGA